MQNVATNRISQSRDKLDESQAIIYNRIESKRQVSESGRVKPLA